MPPEGITDIELGKIIQTLSDLSEKVDKLNTALVNDTDPEKGFIYKTGMRFERLENDKRWGEKFINAFIAAAVAFGFGFLRPK